MPRRKKNRKIKNAPSEKFNDKRNYDENVENTMDTFVNDDIVRNYIGNASLHATHPTLLNLVSGNSGTPSPKLYQHFTQVEAIDSINTTPVNRNRSIHRDRKSSSRKLCITNLNILFDSDYVRNTSYDDDDSDFYVSGRMSVSTTDSIVEIKESNSNVSKKTSRTSQASSSIGIQTVHNASRIFSNQKQNAITETPKKGSSINLEELSNDAYDDNVNHGYNLNNYNKPSTTSSQFNLSGVRVNLNPYLQNNDLRGVLRSTQRDEVAKATERIEVLDTSAGELSFFTPRLFESKSASTPIENVRQNIGNILKDTPFEGSPKNITGNVEVVEKTAKTPNTLYFSCSPTVLQKETNLAKEMFSKSLTTQTSEQSLLGRRSLTPKMTRYINHTRCSRSHSFVCQRMHRALSPRKFPICISESRSDEHDSGTCDKIFTRLKKYSRLSAKWSMRVLEICAQLGVTLKKSLTTICQLYSLDKSLLEESTNGRIKCRCEEYRTEIDRLNTTLKTLTEDLFSVKSLMQEQKENAEHVLRINEELLKVKNELRNFTELKKELDSLKEQVGKVTASRQPVVMQVAPPPPPPPPPLPPPLPPVNQSQTRQSRTLPRRREKKGAEDMRPIISLEDILKVKLKKTSDRASPLRRSTQPVVSMEMLKQVKLKPASRPQTPVSMNDASSSCSSMATSPHSSLTRLLSDSSVCRVKRLKRVSGYSFDDIYRRSQIAKRDRERERTTDS